MKRITLKTIVAAAALLAAGAVNAYSYIYWRTAANPLTSLINGDSVNYTYGKVWYGSYDIVANEKGSGDYLYLVPQDSSEPQYQELDASGLATGGSYWGYSDATDFAGGASDYFVFELYDDAGQVGFLARLYSDMAGYLTDSEGYGASDPYILTGVIPEPSSALLSLVGFAVLALRRKKLA